MSGRYVSQLRVCVDFTIDMGRAEDYAARVSVSALRESVERRIADGITRAANNVTNPLRSDPGAVRFAVTSISTGGKAGR